MVGGLMRALYGTWDAPVQWHPDFAEHLEELSSRPDTMHACSATPTETSQSVCTETVMWLLGTNEVCPVLGKGVA